MPEIFLAKNYLSRQDLEDDIKAKVGQDIADNKTAGHIISGKREEMAKLGIDDLSRIYGIKCEITDSPTNKIKPKK